MMFSELYGAYYETVRELITTAQKRNITADDIRLAVENHAFAESCSEIESAILDGRWALFYNNGATNIKNPPIRVITELEKRWLKTVSLDERIALFDCDFSFLDNVKPLFLPEDIRVFDKYSDSDPYSDREYIKKFRLILDAVKNSYPIYIEQPSRAGGILKAIVQPEKIEYSPKDDKFRVVCFGGKIEYLNIARLTKCEKSVKPFSSGETRNGRENKKTVTLIVDDERNALERVFTHFAHFEKRAESLGNDKYSITITYDGGDETEMIIRVLSFGPFVRVEEPESFKEKIKERLLKQMKIAF